MKVRKRLIGVGVILALVAGLSLPTTLVQASEVMVTLDAPAQVTAGSEFVARLNISHVEDFDAAVVRVRFYPAILSLTDVTDGNIGGTTIPIAALVEKEPGLWGISANVPGFPGVTGSGYLMEFHFLALASSGVDIGLEHHSLSNKDAQLIPATWVGVGDLAVGAVTTPPFNLPLIGGIIAAVVVVGVVIYLVRRRAY